MRRRSFEVLNSRPLRWTNLANIKRSARCYLLIENSGLPNNFCSLPIDLDASLAGRGATVKAGLRPPAFGGYRP
jgi:hypothetical protein